MKKIFSFEINKETLEDETIIGQDEKGNETKTITKVKKLTPQKFFIRKPTRDIKEEAEFYYQKVFSEGVRHGLLTKTLLVKRYDNDGGIFSDGQKKHYQELAVRLFDLEKDFQQISMKKTEDRTPEEITKFDDIKKQIIEIQGSISDLEVQRKSLLNSTAESRGENKTKIWYALFLSYYDNEKPFFGEGKYEDRIKIYDEIEEGADDFLKKVLIRFVLFTSFWFDNTGFTEENFKRLNDLLNAEELKNPDSLKF